jgi:addiction module RelE/StbE family toxin
MRVRWSLPAVDQLCAIRSYIAQDSPDAANRIAAKILSATDKLVQFPSIGRIGRIAGSRELIISGLPYIVTYRVLDEVIDVASVIHTSRKWPGRI